MALVASLSGCFGDGTTRVGSASNMAKPGLYTAVVPPNSDCHWRRLSNLSGQFSAVLALGGSGIGRLFLQVLPTDAAVSSTGCGTWQPVQTASYNPNRATAKPGQYRVPNDLLPGTYAAAGGPLCIWHRFNNWTGVSGSESGNGFSTTPLRVTIAHTDVGFSSYGCGNWTRVGP